MTPEQQLYNMALATFMKKEALPMYGLPVNPFTIGSVGKLLTRLPSDLSMPQRMYEFREKAKHIHPQDTEAVRQLAHEYRDLPHSLYASSFGAKPSGLLRQTAPSLVHSIGLPLGGAHLGSMIAGPLGAGVGSALGGIGSHILNKIHNRELNQAALRRSLG